MSHLSDDQQGAFKTMLEAELSRLESELSSVGRVNPDNPKDWEATPEKFDVSQADRNEAADAIEEFEGHTAILRELEIRLGNVREALKRIPLGTYGLCDVDGAPIPLDRLEANPAAVTCVEHTPKENSSG